MRALCIFLGMLLIAAVAGGALLGKSEVLNPARAQAEASRVTAEAAQIKAEADKVRAQAAQEQQERAIELQRQAQQLEYEQKRQAISLNRLQEQAAQEQREQEIQLELAQDQAAAKLNATQERQAIGLACWQATAAMLPFVGAAALLTVAVAAAYYIVRKAQAIPTPERTPQPPDPASAARARVDDGGSRIRERFLIQQSKVNASRCSYDGFLAFCVDFGLSVDHRVPFSNYTQADQRRRYYPQGISPRVAREYVAILCLARGVAQPAQNGTTCVLRPQIQSVHDLVHRFPRRAFDEILRERTDANDADLAA